MALELVTIEHSANADILKKPAKDVSFPLTPEIITLIEEMKQKVLEIDAVGLAASQVGHHVRIIVFHVLPRDLAIRQDAYEETPMTVLLNPSYSPLETDNKFFDWEGCFSVAERMGKVPRYSSIEYEGYTPTGEPVKGIAKGFLARVLQHEIDHTRGTLIVDLLTPDCVQGHPSEMMPIRKKEMEDRLAQKTD